MKRWLMLLIAMALMAASPVYAMICLDNTDTLEGGASVASKVDYVVSGFTGTTYVNMAEGQLSDTDPSVLYTAAADVSIVSITFVNTHTSAVTVNLYLDPANAGTPRRMIPKDLSLEAGYSMVFDGARCSVLDTNGGIVAGTNVSDTAYGVEWDSNTTVAPSKNAVYDVLNGATTEILVGGGAGSAPVWTTATGTDEPARADSPTFKTKITTPKVLGGTATTQDLDFQTTSGVGAAGADMHFKVGSNGGTEAMTILNSGYVGIGDTSPDAQLDIENGNLKFSTSGTGIDFSATSDATGMTSELLDDYEEGTWTPVLSDGTNNATMSVNTVGYYTKIGNMCFLYGQVWTTSLGSVSGNLRITGLPFAASANTYGGNTIASGGYFNISVGQSVSVMTSAGQTYMAVLLWDSTAGPTAMQHTEWSDDGLARLSISYKCE